MKSNQKFKKKGIMLLSAVLAAFLLTLVASGYFMTLNGSFNAIRSGGEAMKAQRYAEIEANKLSLISYNDLDSKVSQNVWKVTDADDEWEYKVNLDPEKIIDADTGAKQRIATVSVRKDGDSIERFSLKVPISVIPKDIKRKLIAEITDSRTYIENNSVFWGPYSLRSVNTFSIKKPTLISIKYSIRRPDNGYQSNVVAKIDGVAFTNWMRYSVNDEDSTIIIHLMPGTHEIQLFMDADREGGSVVTYQNYKIYEVTNI